MQPILNFHVQTVRPGGGMVVIQLGGPETLTPMNLMRHADRALRNGLAEPDIEKGASIAISLLTLMTESYDRTGWGADLADIRASVLKIRRSAHRCAKLAKGPAADVIQDLIGGIDEVLPHVGGPNAG